MDLSRTSVAGNLLDCEETSSYVVYIYRAFIFQRILIRKCTVEFREHYE